MTKLDVIIISTIFDKYYRLRIDERPRFEKKIGKYVFTTELVDTNDSKLLDVKKFDIDADTFRAIQESQITNVIKFNGFGPLKYIVPTIPRNTIVALGHFEKIDERIYYISEFSENAVITHFIDFDLRKIVCYVPNIKARPDIHMYVIDTDYDYLPSVDPFEKTVRIEQGMLLFTKPDRFITNQFELSSCETLKPPYVIVFGKLIAELVTERIYVRFVPALPKEHVVGIFQGWKFVELFGVKSIEQLKAMGIAPEVVVLGAKFWRDAFMNLERQIHVIRDEVQRMGFTHITQLIDHILSTIQSYMEIAEKARIDIPSLLATIEYVRKMSEKS